jgi:hypothetical protein
MKYVLAAGTLVAGISGAVVLALSASLSGPETLAILIAAALCSIMLYLLILLYLP